MTKPTVSIILSYRIHKASQAIRGLKDEAIRAGGHVNPRHERWGEYLRLKGQASLWLAAKSHARWHAAPGRRAKNLARRAGKLRRKLRNRLEKWTGQPELRPEFAEAARWHEERDKQAADVAKPDEAPRDEARKGWLKSLIAGGDR